MGRYWLASSVQVSPPSLVSKLLLLGASQMAACCSSRARTPPRSSAMGEAICFQSVPPSVVRRRVPALPAIQQTLSEGAEPARRSAVTPLVCSFQDLPASVECSNFPAGPMRQAWFLFGAMMVMMLPFRKRNADDPRPVKGASAELTSTLPVVE